MRHEISLIAALLVSMVFLCIVYVQMTFFPFLAVIGISVWEFRKFTSPQIRLSWEKSFLLCFVLNPVLITVEILIISQFIQNN